jgi:hypothetical protein
MAVRQAIQLKLYTTRSLKRDETAGYIRLVRASGKNVQIPSCATKRMMDPKVTEVRWNPTLT